MQAPYLPEAACRIRGLPDDAAGAGALPYASLPDLVVLKLDASGLRSDVKKKRRDATDAAALLSHATSPCSPGLPPTVLALTPRKREIAREALFDPIVATSSPLRDSLDEKWAWDWWEERLGLGWTGMSPRVPRGAPLHPVLRPACIVDVEKPLANFQFFHACSPYPGYYDRYQGGGNGGSKRPHARSDPGTYVHPYASTNADVEGDTDNEAKAVEEWANERGALAFGGHDNASSPWFYERLDAARVVRHDGGAKGGALSSASASPSAPASAPATGRTRLDRRKRSVTFLI